MSDSPSKPAWAVTTDDPVDWGKYKGTCTYRELAARVPSYCAWAARKIGGLKGQLCAEAIAEYLLGATE